MRTLDELRKEINGKVAIWIWDRCPEAPMNVIFISPPKGPVISIKPYGYEPEEVVKILNQHGFRSFNLKEVEKPEFCISTLNVNENARVRLEEYANMPDEGGIWGFHTKLSDGSPPVCPY